MRPKHQGIVWLVALTALSVGGLVLLGRMGCESARAYLGPCAPTDTLIWHYAVNDTQPSPQNPTTVKAYFYMNGTLYDSTGMAGSTIRYWLPTTGRVWGKVNASSGSTTHGFGEVQYRTTIQSLVVATSDSWTVDSLHAADGNIRNLDGSVAAAKTLTAGERTAIADSVWAQTIAEKTVTSGSVSISGADAKAIADSVILYRIGKALDSGVYDTTFGGRLYDIDTHASDAGWSAITQADCDTVKLSGTPIADVAIIVALSSDKSTVLYWARTDGSGCYTVYVPSGATYAVRPVRQGAWLAAWCTVVK